jgi:hypothetical protein
MSRLVTTSGSDPLAFLFTIPGRQMDVSNTGACGSSERIEILNEYVNRMSHLCMYGVNSAFLCFAYFSDVEMLIQTVLGALLVPFLFALFYFSTSRQKRTFMFFCVVSSVFMVIARAAFTVGLDVCALTLRSRYIHLEARDASLQIKIIYAPPYSLSVLTAPVLRTSAMFAFLPLLMIDLALLCRMLAVYPMSSTPRAQFLSLLLLQSR